MHNARSIRVTVMVVAVLAISAPADARGPRSHAPQSRIVDSVLQPRVPIAPSAEPSSMVAIDAGDPFSIRFAGSSITDPVVLYVVPQGQVFVLTDIDGSYACNCSTCRYDSGGLRLAWRMDDGRQRTYTNGVRFEGGTTITLDRRAATPAAASSTATAPTNSTAS